MSESGGSRTQTMSDLDSDYVDAVFAKHSELERVMKDQNRGVKEEEDPWAIELELTKIFCCDFIALSNLSNYPGDFLCIF